MKTKYPTTLWLLTVSCLLLVDTGFAFSPKIKTRYHDFTQQPQLRSETVFPKHKKLKQHGFKTMNNRASSSRLSLTIMPTEMLADSSIMLSSILDMTDAYAEELAGPLFGFSLFPYLAFLYFLNLKENDCPKGVTVGFTTLLLFVFLTIPAAITAKLQFDTSLANSDWLHGSAESLLTITNLLIVIAFRQALQAKEENASQMPQSATSYMPMTLLGAPLILLAGLTAFIPAAMDAQIHTPYLNGVLDLPNNDLFYSLGANQEPDNALTVACWIIHISSLVEFLVAMGFVWRWADIVQNPKWKGLTWGLLPLHSSGICACTYHLFYNQIAILVPLQAFLTCLGNTTAAYATYRIAVSNGYTLPTNLQSILNKFTSIEEESQQSTTTSQKQQEESESLIGFEDLGNALKGDNDYSFILKLFLGCAVASYAIKYGEIFFDFPYDANVYLGLSVIIIPSLLNAYKWYKRGQDPTFEGWF